MPQKEAQQTQGPQNTTRTANTRPEGLSKSLSKGPKAQSAGPTTAEGKNSERKSDSTTRVNPVML